MRITSLPSLVMRRTSTTLRAISPVIATIMLIAIAATAASIAGSGMMGKSAAFMPGSSTTTTAAPIEIEDMFMIKIADTKVHLHGDYRIHPGWNNNNKMVVTASFYDDSGSQVVFTLPPDDSSIHDTLVNAHVTIGQKYNFIITSTDGNGSSATITKPVFVR